MDFLSNHHFCSAKYVRFRRCILRKLSCLVSYCFLSSIPILPLPAMCEACTHANADDGQLKKYPNQPAVSTDLLPQFFPISSNLLRSEGVVILSSSCDHLPDEGHRRWNRPCPVNIQGPPGCCGSVMTGSPKIYQTSGGIFAWMLTGMEQNHPEFVYKFPGFGRIFFWNLF